MSELVQLAPPACGLFGARSAQEPEKKMAKLTAAEYEAGMTRFRKQLDELGEKIMAKVEARIAKHRAANRPVTFSSTPGSANEMSQAEAVQLVDWATEYGRDVEGFAAMGVDFERFARLRLNEENGVGFDKANSFSAPMLAAIQKRDRQFAAKLANAALR